jgi:hypothetical protein
MKYLFICFCLFLNFQKYNDFSLIEFKDNVAYLRGTNKVANGNYSGMIERRDYFINPNPIRAILNDYSGKVGGIYVFANFRNGIAEGLWELKSTDMKNCGYVNVKSGMLNGECMIECLTSKRKEITTYKDNKIIERIGFNNVGDTLEHFIFINDEIRYFKHFTNWDMFGDPNFCDY